MGTLRHVFDTAHSQDIEKNISLYMFQHHIEQMTGICKIMGIPIPVVDEKTSVKKQIEDTYQVYFQVPKDVSKYLLLSLGSGAITAKVILSLSLWEVWGGVSLQM